MRGSQLEWECGMKGMQEVVASIEEGERAQYKGEVYDWS